MSKTILVVDDSKSVRAVIGTTLKMAGYALETAEDGVEALKLLTEQNDITMDLIITDVNMPNMDGVGLIQEIKKLSKYSHTPICVLTTETEQGKLENELGSLTSAWITKPVQPAHVLNIVGDILSE